MDTYALCDTPPADGLERFRREGWVDAHPTVEVVINGKTVTRYVPRRTVEDRTHAGRLADRSVTAPR